MMRGLALSWVLIAACDFASPRLARPDGGGAGGDAAGCTSFSMQLDTCALPSPFPLTLAGVMTFNTGTGVLRDAMVEIPVVTARVMTRGAEVRALVASTVSFAPGAILRAEGAPGFAIVASGDIMLSANTLIDVSQGGAGHRLDCGGDRARAGTNDTGGGSGGGGGGFGAAGGAGGNGNSDGGQVAGGEGGRAAPMPPDGPIGGCPGARGGNGDNASNPGGDGGPGGGAVYLVSAVAIRIGSGAGLHAGGAGGGGGGRNGGDDGDAGGGGGGSGGSIFLEAPVILSQGTLAANGGGGGEGSGGGAAGQPGTPGLFAIVQAMGGQGGSSTGANGGGGGFLTNRAGAAPTQVLQGGGGGGGGSVGFIRVSSPNAQLGAMVSPPAM